MKRIDIQQGSSEWEQIRKTHITGTILKGILGTPKARQEMLYQVIADRLTVGVGSDNEENPMDRGSRLEPEAVAAFEFETGKQVEKVGFCKSDEQENIGVSPDGYIVSDKCNEAIEIKCPLGKNYVKGWLTDVVPEEYQWQVVQYFVVDPELQKLHFVLYNPDIPSHPLHIIEVERTSIEDEIARAIVEQKKFLLEVNEKLKGLITI